MAARPDAPSVESRFSELRNRRGAHEATRDQHHAERASRAHRARYAVAIAGLVLLASAAGGLAIVLLTLLVLAGLDLVLTGALGHCPLYPRLGHLPLSLRRPA